jgi:hypothetical protein
LQIHVTVGYYSTTVDETEMCKYAFERSLRRCDGSVVGCLLQASYFVSAAVRPLRTDELLDLVTTAATHPDKYRGPGSDCTAFDVQDSQTLLAICAELLELTLDGHVTFRNQQMTSYLRQIQYSSGPAEEPLTRMCFLYLQEGWNVFKPWRSSSSSPVRSQRPFFNYASAHWHRHYRSVEGLGSDIAAELYQKVKDDVMSLFGREGYLHIELNQLTLQFGLSLSRSYRFPLLTKTYEQMGAGFCSLPSVSDPFLTTWDYSMFTKDMIRIQSPKPSTEYLLSSSAMQSHLHDWTGGIAPCRTDSESGMEDSWASLEHEDPPDVWYSGLDDLRLDDTVLLRKGDDGDGSGWQMIYRSDKCRP